MNNRWRIYVYFKNGMSLITFQVACAYSFQAACQVADTIEMKRSKGRGVLFKRVGDKRRIYTVQEYYQWYGWQEYQAPPPEPPPAPEPEAEMTQLPLLEAPNPFTSVWRSTPPSKRRL